MGLSTTRLIKINYEKKTLSKIVTLLIPMVHWMDVSDVQSLSNILISRAESVLLLKNLSTLMQLVITIFLRKENRLMITEMINRIIKKALIFLL